MRLLWGTHHGLCNDKYLFSVSVFRTLMSFNALYVDRRANKVEVLTHCKALKSAAPVKNEGYNQTFLPEIYN